MNKSVSFFVFCLEERERKRWMNLPKLLIWIIVVSILTKIFGIKIFLYIGATLPPPHTSSSFSTSSSGLQMIQLLEHIFLLPGVENIWRVTAVLLLWFFCGSSSSGHLYFSAQREWDGRRGRLYHLFISRFSASSSDQTLSLWTAAAETVLKFHHTWSFSKTSCSLEVFSPQRHERASFNFVFWGFWQPAGGGREGGRERGG